MKDLLPFHEARARVLQSATALSPERCGVESSVGRVLAEDLFATQPMPAFDYSAMDGYAVRASEIGAGAELTVVGESRTGGELPELKPGTACRIFTGARIPPGADAVVMQEHATRTGDSVRMERAVRPGDHIRRAGEDLAVGVRVLPRGTRLTAYHVGLLCALGRTKVSVSRRPSVAILSTGDELREVGAIDRPGSVIDSNGPGLAAMVRQCGGDARVLPFAGDSMEATRTALEQAMERSDLVLTVGGVSVGDHDLVRAALSDIGVSLDFWRVAIKPGKPVALGRSPGGSTVLCLPGNPSSAMLTFVLFGAPLLRTLQGDLRAAPGSVKALAAGEIRHAPGRLEFVRGRLDETSSPARFAALPNQSSGSVSSFAWANALAMIPLDAENIVMGAEVECMRLDDV